MTNEKIEIVAETEITGKETADNETEDSKSSVPELPDYDQATENQTKNAEEVAISEFRSETPAEIFAASQSTADAMTWSSQSVTNQPQNVQPIVGEIQ